jgi:NADH-quinone oxidoreductase subunit L
MPSVYWLFLAGAVSLSAFPLLGGFFSKDRILLATFLNPGVAYKVLWFLGVVAAVLTPLYTFRAFFVAFPERPDGRRAEEVHLPPRFMAAVLWPLAVLALGDGLLNLPGGIGKNFLGNYMAPVPGARPDLGASASLEWVMGLGTAVSVMATIVLAYYLYRRRPAREPAREGCHEFLFSGMYLDHLYRLAFVRPYEAVSEFLWRRVDEGVVDRGYVRLAQGFFYPYWAVCRFLWQKVDEVVLDNGVVQAAGQLVKISGGLGRWTTGRLSTYLTMLLLGLAVCLGALAVSWYLL